MGKVTESRRRILSIFSSKQSSVFQMLRQIQEIVSNDDNWNEPQEAKQEEGSANEKTILDVIIDVLPDE